jgi:hypothetical protein
MWPKIFVALWLAGALLPTGPAAAQHTAGEGAQPEGSAALRAARVTGSIRVDGRLDDPAWEAASVAGSFVQREPNAGAPASRPTEVRVLYDSHTLYVGARLYDAPDSIAAQLARRDAARTYSDWFSVMLDSYHDRRTAFVFGVNPRGVQQDARISDDTRRDASWDAVWEVATGIDSLGWTAELRIPLSQLRFDPGRAAWGVNFERRIARRDEVAYWAPTPPDAAGLVSRFGELAGLEGLSSPERLELAPYAVARVIQAPGDRADPFYAPNSLSPDLGLDLKYRVASNLTLAGTVNPDFGQVEADPAVVNLTAYETFFPERRPFFVEGSNILDFPLTWGGSLLYSRRMGRAPQRRISKPGGFVDTPEVTTILGAAKLTGRTAGGWSVGLMNVLTSAEEARVMDGSGKVRTETVEPLSSYAALRLIRDFRRGGSRIGMMLTGVHRDLEDEPALQFLRSSAYAAAAEGEHRFRGGNYLLSGQLGGSYIQGSQTAIRLAQMSPARYYHRPDAPHLDFDSTRNSLAGYFGSLTLSKIGGGHWRWMAMGHLRSPGLELNDAGFQSQADQIFLSGHLRYEQFRPGKTFRNWTLAMEPSLGFTFGGERFLNMVNVFGNAQLRNFWKGSFFVRRSLAALNPWELQGGPAIVQPPSTSVSAMLSTDPRTRVSFQLGSGTMVEDGTSRRMIGVSPGVTLRPSGRFDLSVSGEFSANRNPWQYVAQRRALGEVHYVFAEIDQVTTSLNTRLNYSFTPALTLQVYAQPFVSAVDYADFREVADPRASRFGERFHTFGAGEISDRVRDGRRFYDVDLNGDERADFSFVDPDFNSRQLRSNVVLRWEYRPGSTLYVVWNRRQNHLLRTGRYSLRDDMRDLFGAAETDVFLLKLSYWFDR